MRYLPPRIIGCGILILVLLVTSRTRADALVVTRAMQASTILVVFVQPQVIRVTFEVGLSDLSAFQNVLPDAMYEQLTSKQQPLSERFTLFVTNDWELSAEGERLADV